MAIALGRRFAGTASMRPYDHPTALGGGTLYQLRLHHDFTGGGLLL